MAEIRCRVTAVVVFLSLISIIGFGCRLFEDSRPPVLYTLAIYAPVPGAQPDGQLVRSLPSQTGESVRVAAFPVLSSKDFLRIERITNADGTLSLRAELDRHGRFAWMQIRTERPGRELAVALEGAFHSFVPIPARVQDDEYIVLPGPWSAAEADAIVEYAPGNYEQLWE